jgi:hypothetical protein
LTGEQIMSPAALKKEVKTLLTGLAFGESLRLAL